MLSTFKNAWRIPELRKKMLFTLFLLVVFRLGSAIPVPYINRAIVYDMVQKSQGGVLEFLDMMGGGSFSRFSIFATSIYPYITASIVIQLLAIVIPKLGEWAKEGEEGKKKMAQITRYLGIAMAAVQASGFAFIAFRSAIVPGATTIQKIIIVLTMVAGTSFLIWMGDVISEKGIGNGISLIIFAGIISRLPNDIIRSIGLVSIGSLSIIKFIIHIVIMIAIIVFVITISEGERRIPVQYAKRVVGRKMYGGQSTHIPVKVSMAGVLPVIFASSLLAVPQTIAEFTKSTWITEYFSTQGTVGIWVYSIFNFMLVLFFTYFYTSIQFNTVEYAKNLQQNGGFIPGIRPGRFTSEYLSKVVQRVTFIGGISLAFLATLPMLTSGVFGMRTSLMGTSVIIVVGVALETVKQLEAQMMMRHYKGFLNN